MRFWEIDFARGIAIILMIIFNWSYTLRYFNILQIDAGWLYWGLFPRFIGSMFIFVAGISLVLSYKHLKNKKTVYHHNMKRGVWIFSLGMLITLITWLFSPEIFVRFGILHLIGLSIIIATPFLKFDKINLILGSLIILFGSMLQIFAFDFQWLLWLGFVPKNFITFDYFPIFPWFGFILLGIYFGNRFYNKKRKFSIPNFSNKFIIKITNFLGRNSLTIYLLHQPLLLFILFIFGFPLFS